MTGIGIIANPHSKLNRRNPNRPKLLSYIVGQRGQLEMTQSLEELQSTTNAFYSQDVELIAINGGDGTVSQTITAIIQSWGSSPLPKIALLRGGTMNMLADNLHVNGSPEHLLYRLLEAHSENKDQIQEVSTLKIGGKYGFLFASGTSARYLQEFYKKKTGALDASLLVAKLSLGGLLGGNKLFNKIVQSEPVTIQIDHQKKLQQQSCSVFCSTVQDLPMKRKLFPKADGNFIHGLNVRCSAKNLVKKLTKHFLINPQSDTPEKFRFSGSSINISYDQKWIYTLDGEIYTTDKPNLAIELGPKINFVRI